MSYDVSFKAKLEGTDQWVPVGADWINHTSNTAAMIKEVCGSYPSAWDGRTCKDLLPILRSGIELLQRDPDHYRSYEPDNRWGTVESTLEFLRAIADNCRIYPTAVIEVSY